MSVISGFTLAVMIFFVGYILYRLFKRRRFLVLVSLCLQIFAISSAAISFIQDVQTTNEFQAVQVLSGVLLPALFFIYDYMKMIKKVKQKGVYGGLVEALPKKTTEAGTGMDLEDGHISAIMKELDVNQVIEGITFKNTDMTKNLKNMLREARALIREKEFEKAALMYGTMTKLIGSSPELYYNYGNTCYRIGRYEDAEESYRKALQEIRNLRHKNNTSSDVINPGEINPSQAISENTPIIIKLDEAMIYYNMANSQYKRSMYTDAIDSYEKCLKINPRLLNACENIARALIAAGKTQAAIEYYSKIVERNMDDPKAHYSMASLYYKIKNYSMSIEEYGKCLNLNPMYAEAYEGMARALTGKGKHTEAVNIYKKLLKLRPDYPGVTYNLGMSMYHAGMKKESLSVFEKMAEKDPGNYRYHYNMAVAFDELGRQEEAIKAFKRVIELKPDFIEAYNNLGIVLSTMGRHMEAFDIYYRALKIQPGEYSIYYNLGVALSDTGRHKEAVEAYKKALEIKPDEGEINYHLGAALIELKQYDEAVKIYKDTLKIRPDDCDVYYNLAMVYGILKKYDIAIDSLRKAIELNNNLKEEARYNFAFNSMKHRQEFRELVS